MSLPFERYWAGAAALFVMQKSLPCQSNQEFLSCKSMVRHHTIMKTTKSLFTIVSAIVLAGCSATSSHREVSGMAKTHIVVMVSCSNPDTKFTGTIVSDGHPMQLSGTG